MPGLLKALGLILSTENKGGRELNKMKSEINLKVSVDLNKKQT